MKFIKKYEEVSKSYDEVYELISEFIDDEGLTSSFTSYYNDPGDQHIAKLKRFLRRKGVDLDSFMKENIDKILEDDLFISYCGFMDYLVYNYDKTFPLSGFKCESDPDEIEIKYDYGYQNYDLGRKYLLQSFDSISKFYISFIENKLEEQDVVEDFYKIIEYDNTTVLLFIIESVAPEIKVENRFNISDNVEVLVFADQPIRNKEELDEYLDFSGMVEKLEIVASANKYNL